MIEEIKSLVAKLNYLRDQYYNHQISEVSDFEYDTMFDRLAELEKETGFIMATSPTQTVGYEVKSELEKVRHNHLMLSLDKTKSVDDIAKFIGDKEFVGMPKMDGLTCSMRYIGGQLVSAETRGNGEIGESVLSCAKTIKNLPLQINYKDELIVDGEVIISYDDFQTINSKLPDNEKYKNPRNLVSGSIRQLDSSIAAQRNMRFIAWKCITPINSNDSYANNNSFDWRLRQLENLGFETVYCFYEKLPRLMAMMQYRDKNETDALEDIIRLIQNWANDKGYPLDGCVFGYNDIAYGESLGATGHHLRSQLAYKFYDDEYETTLRDIEWTMGKTGILTPTAVFEPVEIDGTMVERASLHNISIMKKLFASAYKRQPIKVYKANMIIPQVSWTSPEYDGVSEMIWFPTECPICHSKVEIVKENESEVLVCTNDNCSGKLLGKLAFFVSKKAMDIDGMSEATLSFLIEKGWVTKYADLYHLDQYADRWARCEGFGEKSVNSLLKSIEKSRNVKLENFICALSIPNIGSSAAKTIAKSCNGSWDTLWDMWNHEYDFTQLEDIGSVTADNFVKFFDEYINDIDGLAAEMHFIVEEKKTIENDFIKNKVFVVTGAFNTMKRSDIEKIITERGGKLSGSVSKATSYLLTNEANSGSSKAKKAAELGTPIMDEETFIKMIGE